MLRASHALSATLLACLAVVAAPAHAQFGGGGVAPVTIDVVATDLFDTSALDLWQFDFTVNGQMETGSVLNITLSPSLYRDLSVVTSQIGYTAQIAFPPLSQVLRITDNGSSATTSLFSIELNLVAGQWLYPGQTRTSPLQQQLPGTFDLGATYQASPFSASSNPDLRAFTMTPGVPVPEPATYGLMALGLVGMGLRRRAQKV